MIVSDPFHLTFNGKPALLHVLRNSGYCWGRISFKDEADEAEFDVYTDADYYEDLDEVAAAVFIRASRDPKHVQPYPAESIHAHD